MQERQFQVPTYHRNIPAFSLEAIEAKKVSFCTDHTLGAPTGNFMTLSGVGVQRAGDRAWMVSPIINGSSKPKCLSFW